MSESWVEQIARRLTTLQSILHHSELSTTGKTASIDLSVLSENHGVMSAAGDGAYRVGQV